MPGTVQMHPLQDMLTLREAMNQLFEDSVVRPNERAGAGGRTETFAPAIDVSETTASFIVEASVPGLSNDDLDITVENNVLTISGQIRKPENTNDRTYHRVERRYGKFQRSIMLPNTVKVDAINASLAYGILRLEIPKADEVKPRRINVNVQGA